MSLRGKDFRCELDPVLHEQLRTMADFHDLDLASFGSKLLEKAICGEWYEFSLLMEKAARCGIVRNRAEGSGK